MVPRVLSLGQTKAGPNGGNWRRQNHLDCLPADDSTPGPERSPRGPGSGTSCAMGVQLGDRPLGPGLRGCDGVARAPLSATPALRRPGRDINSEHLTEYTGTPDWVVLVLLYDFPDPGNFTGFRV